MAIFGNLNEFPFIEVLAMLEQRVGVLRFSNIAQYQTLELHLSNGQLQGMQVDSHVVRESFEARSYLMELVGQHRGEFSFDRRDAARMLNDFSLSARSVLFQGAAYLDEIQQYKNHLPEPTTVFTMAVANSSWLDDDLKPFWERAQSLLSRHSSAEEIARALNLNLNWVQLALYKLRLAGFVRPVRRVSEPVAGLQTPFGQADSPRAPLPNTALLNAALPNTPVPGRPTLVSRLLGALGLMRRSS